MKRVYGLLKKNLLWASAHKRVVSLTDTTDLVKAIDAKEVIAVS